MCSDDEYVHWFGAEAEKSYGGFCLFSSDSLDQEGGDVA